MSLMAALPKPVTKQFINDLQLYMDKTRLKTNPLPYNKSLAGALFPF